MILSVNELAFTYPSHSVLQKINFSICKGDFLAVLGVNGAGKSTLLKCINRVLKPCEVRLFYSERRVGKLSQREIAKRIGYVAQRQESVCMTVYDAVLLGENPIYNGRLPRRILKLPISFKNA